MEAGATNATVPDRGKSEQKSGAILDVLRRMIDVRKPRRQIGRGPARGRQAHRRREEIGTDHDKKQEEKDKSEGG